MPRESQGGNSTQLKGNSREMGTFLQYIYNFFLKPILLPSTDLYFINFQFCKRGWEALRAVAAVAQLPVGREPPPPISTVQRLEQPSIPKLSWPRTAGSLPQNLMNHWNVPWGH